MIGGGEVFDGDGGASGPGELGEYRAKIVERAVKGYVFKSERWFPTDGPEFGLGWLDGGAADEEVFF